MFFSTVAWNKLYSQHRLIRITSGGLYCAKALVLYTRSAPPARIPSRVTAHIASPVVPAFHSNTPSHLNILPFSEYN